MAGVCLSKHAEMCRGGPVLRDYLSSADVEHGAKLRRMFWSQPLPEPREARRRPLKLVIHH